MQYCNVKVPNDVAWLDTDKDIFTMMDLLVGPGYELVGEPLHYDASIGYSSYGPYCEGDIGFCKNGYYCGLSYDFMGIGNDTARVFRYEVTQHGVVR